MSNLPRSAVAAMCCISGRLGQSGGDGVRMPPAADMMARHLDEDAEPHLPGVQIRIVT